MSDFPVNGYFRWNEKMFIAIVKMSERDGEVDFLTGEDIEKLGDFLGIKEGVCSCIRRRFRDKFGKEISEPERKE